jgi:signal peptidase I
MELSKGVDRFQARWNLQSGACTLYRIVKEGDQRKAVKLAEADTLVKAKGDYSLRFANVDQRLTVWVDGELPFGDGKEYPPPERVGPDDELDSNVKTLDDIKNNDLQPASLCAVGAAMKVHALRVYRDIYYTGSVIDASDHRNRVSGDDWKNPAQWAPLRELPVKTFYVQPGHYFVLGDNSPESSDSRYWGVVPTRRVMGRALLTYLPWDRAGWIK